MPVRIQFRHRGRLARPDCSCGCGNPAIYVGRPTIYGNPFRAYRTMRLLRLLGRHRRQRCHLPVDHSQTRRPRSALTDRRGPRTTRPQLRRFACSGKRAPLARVGAWCGEPSFAIAVADLAGHDLMCWCPLDRPCHADVLLELANRPHSPTTRKAMTRGIAFTVNESRTPSPMRRGRPLPGVVRLRGWWTTSPSATPSRNAGWMKSARGWSDDYPTAAHVEAVARIVSPPDGRHRGTRALHAARR